MDKIFYGLTIVFGLLLLLVLFFGALWFIAIILQILFGVFGG